tara:strand:- start:55 stop:2457 length:2403 start_codon:yes stop_codon:yes gene_type:complete
MAYGELYRVNFFDTDEHKFLLQIFEDGYSGLVSDNLTLGDNPVVVSYQQDNNFFNPIIGSSCKLQFYVEEGTGGGVWNLEETNWNLANFLWNAEGSIDFLEPSNDREFKVVLSTRNATGTTTSTSSISVLKDSSATFTSKVKVGDIVINENDNTSASVTAVTDNNTLVLSSDIFTSGTTTGKTYSVYRKYWTGFIVQDSFNLPLQDFPFLIEAYASDLIGTLDGYEYELTTTQPTGLQAIVECLRQINIENGQGDSGKSLDFSYKFLCRIKPTSASGVTPSYGNPYDQIEINDVSAFRNENGNNLDAKFILSNLLLMFNCRIFQHENTWTIISNDSYSLSAFDTSYTNAIGNKFITYDKNGSNESTESFTSAQIIQNINSSGSANTIQPMNKDLIKTIKRPAVRARVNTAIKNLLKSNFTNGDFESTSAPSGSIPSDAYAINTWTITDTATTFAVDSNTATFGITPYQGSKCLINIGNDTANGGDTNLIASNNTANFSNTFLSKDLKLNYAIFADQPATYDGNLLNYNFYWRLTFTPDGGGTTKYWDVINNEWKSSSVKNRINNDVANEWVRYSFDILPLPSTGNITIEFYEPEEANFPLGTSFRFYIDDVDFVAVSDLEYYSTLVNITDTTFRKNSGVIPPFDVRFGQIEDTGYANALVNTVTPPSAIVTFDHQDLSEAEDLEAMMCRLRLADLSDNNNMYEGTFRKTSDSDNLLLPISMLTFPKLNFTTLPDNTDQMAIDNLEWNVSKNRYKIKTHVSNQSNLRSFSSTSRSRGFFTSRPEDSADPLLQYAYARLKPR